MGDATFYRNQQLNSVALSVFFKGRFRVLAHLHELQDAIADELPDVFVPNAKEGAALALQPSHFRAENGSEQLAVALNQVGYVSTDYPGHERFVARGLGLIAKALSTFDVRTVDRISYSYDNAIGLARNQSGLWDLGEIVADGQLPGWVGDGAFLGFSCSADCKTPIGFRRTSLALEESDGIPVVRLMIVSTAMGPVLVGGLKELSMRAHDDARETFEGLASDKFKGFLSGVDDDE